MAPLHSDTVIFNGKVYTIDEGNSVAEAVAIRDGRFALVGTESEVLETAGPRTRRIDLAGRIALPGFIDTHIHPSNAGNVFNGKIDIKAHQPATMAALLELVRRQASITPEGGWIVGFGYDEWRLREGRHPDRWELDEAAPRNPVLLRHTCGHIVACNSLALRLGGITKETPDPPQGRIDRRPDGEPTGVLRNRAGEPVRRQIPPLAYEEAKEGLRLALERLASWGVTSIHDAWTGPSLIRAYQELHAEGRLPIRVGLTPPMANPMEGDVLDHLSAVGLRMGFGSPMLRINGMKVAVDGMLRSETAALREAYEGQPGNRGIITIDLDRLQNRVSACHGAGLRACIHAEGDRAIDAALDAIERALEENPAEDPRHRLDHFGLCNPDQMRRMKGLGVIPSSSINFVHDIGEGYTAGLGPDRCERVYPLKALRDAGIVGSCNSDWPVAKGDPLVGICSAVARRTWRGEELGPSQRLPVVDAVRANTMGGAYSSFEEGVKGSIEEGKLADLVVLSEDILDIPPAAILKARVDVTIVGGEVVYQRAA